MKHFILIVYVIIAFSSILKANEVFYDITFSSPEHTVGQVPVTGSSPTRPSKIVFGAPIVSSSLGLLQNQPLVFNTTGNQPSFYYDQIKLNVGKNEDFYYVAFDLLTQNLIGSTNGFTILFDTPTVRNIYFNNDGSIRIFVPGGPSGIIGSFTDNTLMHCEVYLHMIQEEWEIFVNDNLIHSDLFRPESDIEYIRFSLGLNGPSPDHTTNVGLDNIIVADYVVSQTIPPVAVDIKPGSCPNPLNVKSRGVLPIAILGTADFDVTTIDPTSIRLAGAMPLRSGYEDVATPVSDSNNCNCTTDGPDGFPDLTLKFKTQKIVEAIGDVNDGDVLELQLVGVLYDETPIEGADCIVIRGKHKLFNKADINKDGIVNAADFAIIAQNWLQSSIVED